MNHVPSQAPVSMKAVCQAAWLWTVAFGNLVVIIIAEGRLFANQVSTQEVHDVVRFDSEFRLLYRM